MAAGSCCFTAIKTTHFIKIPRLDFLPNLIRGRTRESTVVMSSLWIS